MRGAWQFVNRFGIQRSILLGDNSGQATVEYILLLSFSVGISILMARGFIATLDKGMLRIGAQLEQDLKSGRAPLSVWKN